MKLELRLWHIILLVAVGIAIFWLYSTSVRGKYQREVDRLNTGLYQAERKVKRYSIVVDSLEESVAQSDLLVVSSRRKIKQLHQETERLKQLNIKRVKTIGELKLKIRVLKDSIPPSDTLIIKKDCDGEDGKFIKLPLNFKYNDPYVKLNTDVGMDGHASMNFNILSMPLNVAIGSQRESLFGKSTDVSVVSSSSPYVDVESIKFISVEDKRKTPAHYLMVGTGVGIAASILTGLILF